MARPPDIIARIRFYATKDGGRKGPTPTDFYRCPLEFEGEKFDCALHLHTVGSIAPGMLTRVPITLLCPALIKPRLKIGISSRFGNPEQ